MLIEEVLAKHFRIKPRYIIDNKMYKFNKSISSSDVLDTLDENYVVILTTDNSSIIENLRWIVSKSKGKYKVLDMFPRVTHSEHRIKWLRRISEMMYANCVGGNVSECGVYKGEFARYINEFFPDKKCYLFDSYLF